MNSALTSLVSTKDFKFKNLKDLQLYKKYVKVFRDEVLKLDKSNEAKD